VRAPMVWLLVPSLAGCVAGGALVPWPGVWDYRDEGVVQNTCPDDLYQDPDATFVVQDVAADGFTIVEQERFACALTGRDFACPERRRVDLEVGETTLSWAVRVDGRFDTPRRLHGTQTFSVSCVGGLCALDTVLLGVSLPCTYEVAFSATAR